MRKKKVVILLGLVCALAAILATSAFAVDIEALIDLFISNPEAGTAKLVELAKTDPESVALVLAGVAERAPELADSIMLTCLELVDTEPSAAALVINTIKDRAPEIGERIEMIAVAYGLEESYLRAASPVRP